MVGVRAGFGNDFNDAACSLSIFGLEGASLDVYFLNESQVDARTEGAEVAVVGAQAAKRLISYGHTVHQVKILQARRAADRRVRAIVLRIRSTAAHHSGSQAEDSRHVAGEWKRLVELVAQRCIQRRGLRYRSAPRLRRPGLCRSLRRVQVDIKVRIAIGPQSGYWRRRTT